MSLINHRLGKYNKKYMSHEIEAEFVAECENEAVQCQRCTSFLIQNDQYFCAESQSPVPPNGHCNFFQSTD